MNPVIYTPPKLSEGFYDELWTEIAGGGIEAFYHYLLHLDLSDFNPKSEPPGTVAKRDLAEEPYAKVRIVPASKAKTGEKAEFTRSK